MTVKLEAMVKQTVTLLQLNKKMRYDCEAKMKYADRNSDELNEI